MFEQGRQGGEAAADRGRARTLLLALNAFPRNNGAMTDLPELVHRLDAKGPHEVAHVEPVGAAGAGTFLRRQPDFFFGPQAWLADVLARIAAHPVHRLDELLPWNWTPRPSEASAAAA